MAQIQKTPFARPLHLFILLFATAGIVPALAAATATGDTLSVVLEPITVEATHSAVTLDRASMSISTVRRSLDDMTSRRASTMDEITFTLPGIWISNRENHALGERLTVRGMGWRSQFGVRGVQIVMDDIPLTVADGQSVMNLVDPAMIQSIELLRGPSASFWGNSSGGVLYMRTRPPADAPNLMVRSFGGSFNTIKNEVRWHDRIGGVRWNAYGSHYDTEGYRDYSAARLFRAGLSAGFDTGENSTMEARVAYSGMPMAEHPGSLNRENAAESPSMAWPFNVNTGSGKEFQQLMAAGNFLRSFEGGVLNISAHGTYRDLVNPLPGPYITVDRLAGGSRATYDFTTLPFRLQLGADLRWQRDERDQWNNDGGSPGDQHIISQLDRVGNQALFAKSAFDAGRFTFSLGARADRMSFRADSIDTVSGGIIPYPDENRIFTTVNPSAGITYHLPDARIYTNASTSFESPTTTEFKNRLGPDGNILPGFNPDLNPEKTVGLEAGIRGYRSGLNLEYDFALFGLFVEDQIIQETEIDGQAIFSNGGNAEHFGLEAHLRYRPVRAVSLELMYTWVDARFSGGELAGQLRGNRLPGVAPHRFGAAVTTYLGNHVLGLDIERVGEYFVDSENSAVNDAYMLLNSRWTFDGLQFTNWSLHPFLSVHNIFDTRYNTSAAINNAFGRYFEPGAGRSFQFGLSLRI